MIPFFKDVKKEAEEERACRDQKLLREFDEFMEGRFPSMGTLSSPCPDKFLSISSLVKEKYVKYGWDIDFDCKFSCGEVFCNRVVIKGIK